MELIEKTMGNLFAQLGEPNDEASMARFIAQHGALAGGTALHEAACWKPSQATFLREALVLDAAWAPVVDALNAQFHGMPGTDCARAIVPAAALEMTAGQRTRAQPQ